MTYFLYILDIFFWDTYKELFFSEVIKCAFPSFIKKHYALNYNTIHAILFFHFQVRLTPFKKNCFNCLNESPLKILKAIFVLKYLNFCVDFLAMQKKMI